MKRQTEERDKEGTSAGPSRISLQIKRTRPPSRQRSLSASNNPSKVSEEVEPFDNSKSNIKVIDHALDEKSQGPKPDDPAEENDMVMSSPVAEFGGRIHDEGKAEADETFSLNVPATSAEEGPVVSKKIKRKFPGCSSIDDFVFEEKVGEGTFG